MSYQIIINHLKALANQKIAEHSHTFFKTGEGEYGYGDKFLGIRVPIVRQAVKKYQSTELITIEKLLHSEFHEIRLFALLHYISYQNLTLCGKEELLCYQPFILSDKTTSKMPCLFLNNC